MILAIFIFIHDPNLIPAMKIFGVALMSLLCVAVIAIGIFQALRSD